MMRLLNDIYILFKRPFEFFFGHFYPFFCAFAVCSTGILLLIALYPAGLSARAATPPPGIQGAAGTFEQARRDTVPEPRKVMLRSLMLPGWGQYTNRQSWKIPLVYGLIGGVAYYAYYADDRYRGYRAAFYNSVDENQDLRFGPTPSWINPNLSGDFLRSQRNFYRNRRDFLIIATVLAYGLNVLDAYIFAHMRDFDVGDDLSFRAVHLDPRAVVALPVPALQLRIRF